MRFSYIYNFSNALFYSQYAILTIKTDVNRKRI